MFNKPLAQGSRNLLGNKERKKLRGLIVARFGTTEGEVDDVLLPRGSETTLLSLKGSKTQVYFSQGEPLFFDVDGSGDLFPTCYALEKVSNLVPSFLIHSNVSEYILKGADLMLPGIIRPTSLSAYGKRGLFKNGCFSIRVVSNPIPFAVGRCLLNGLCEDKGKALEVFHTFGDHLWGLGSKAVPDGFTLKTVLPLDPPYEEDHEYYRTGSTTDQSVSESLLNTVEYAIGKESLDEIDDSWESHSLNRPLPTDSLSFRSVDEHERTRTSTSEPPESTDTGLNIDRGEPVLKQESKTVVSLPVSIVDSFLELTLLETLHTDILDSACPITCSAVLSKMIQVSQPIQFSQPFRNYLAASDTPPDVFNQIDSGDAVIACDIKKSSYKKLSKFFQFYSKKNLLQTKEVRGDFILISINRQHPMYKGYSPIPEKDKKYATKLLGSCTDSGLSKQADSFRTPQSNKKSGFEVLEFYQPDNNSMVIFETAKTEPSIADKYFDSAQCRQALDEYIKQKTVSGSTQSAIILDPILQRCVMSRDERSKLAEGAFPEMERSEVSNRFLSHLQAYHSVTKADSDPRMSSLVVRRGKLKPVVVQLGKRAGSKAVTTISGLSVFEIDERNLAEILQKALAASASTFEMTGAAKGKAKPLGVLVQGSFVSQIAEMLSVDFGIPKRFISTK